MVMQRFWLGTVAAIALAAGGAVQAADLPVKAPPAAPVAVPVVNWSGFYIGGRQIGYQSQVEKWVFGIEATWSVLDLHQTKASILDPTSLRSIKIDDIATVGGRFGYAGWERVLVYARAAYATARIGVHGVEGGSGITSDTV